MTVSSSIKYACFRSSTIASRFSVIASPRMPSLPRLVSMLYDLLIDLVRSTPRMYPRTPRLNANRKTQGHASPQGPRPSGRRSFLSLLQFRLCAGLHRSLYALLGVSPGRGRDPGREGPFDEGGVDQPDLLSLVFGQHLEYGLSGEDGAAEVHEHEHLLGFEIADGSFDPLRVRAERAIRVASYGRDLDLTGHLQDEVRRTLGDLLAVRDEHDPYHQEEPSRVRAAASRSMYVEVAPGS